MTFCEPCKKSIRSDIIKHNETSTHLKNLDRMPVCSKCDEKHWYADRKRKECKTCYDEHVLSLKPICKGCNQKQMTSLHRSDCHTVYCDPCYKNYRVDLLTKSVPKMAEIILDMQEKVAKLEQELEVLKDKIETKERDKGSDDESQCYNRTINHNISDPNFNPLAFFLQGMQGIPGIQTQTTTYTTKS